MDRRTFLTGAAAAARAVAANDRVSIAFIGTGTRGGDGLIPMFLPVAECQAVAVCDLWQDRREAAAKKINDHYGTRGCALYDDFRELLLRKDIDAVAIATPDHWHVPLAILAVRAGKDVYVEKPLGVSIQHARKLRQVLAERKRVFQYGTQQRGSKHVRVGCELVRQGRIGKVHTVYVRAPGGARGGSTATLPAPKGFNFDMWLGPGPQRGYSDDLCRQPSGHYFNYDFSLGYIAGWGAHPLDVAQLGLGADNTSPVEYEGRGYIPRQGLYTAITSWVVDCRYANGVRMFFIDDPENETKFVGDEGWISITRTSISAHPANLLPAGLKQEPGNHIVHARDFITAVQTRGTPQAPFEAAFHSDAISHLANIAIRTGRKIKWDPVREMIIDDAEASNMLDRPRREPWNI